MPTTSGDAYAAPGRAMQQMGGAISGLGEALFEAQQKEDGFDAKLKMLNHSNDVDLEAIKYQRDYNGDPKKYEEGLRNIYQQRTDQLYQDIPQSQRRQVTMYDAQKRGSTFESAARHQSQLIIGQRYAEIETTISAGVKRLGETPPEQFDTELASQLTAANRMIDTMPGATPQHQESLRNKVAGLVFSTLNAEPKDGATSVEQILRTPVADRMVKDWIKNKSNPAAADPFSGAPGPQSSVGGIVPKPGTIAAVTDQSERSYNAQGYGEKLTGKITVNGNTYEFVNGGSKRGSIPHGEYEIQRYTSGDQRAKEGYQYTKDAFQLSDKADDAPGTKGDTRRGLLIHDGNRGVTAGCIGIKGNFEQFKADMQAEMQKNGGKLKLNLGGPQQVAAEGGGAAGGEVVDFRGKDGPASLRYNNPGAMYPGPSAQKFGAVGTETIGGGHKIAVFPNAVAGAAAQFDLLASDKYTGQSVRDAIAKWSGGNSVDTYLKVLQKEAGVGPDEKLTAAMVRDPKVAIPLAKAMATQEAGKAYPMSDQQWQQAHDMAFGKDGTAVAQRGPQGTRVASLGGGPTIPGSNDNAAPVNQKLPPKVVATLTGTPEEKDAKLRELVAQGYQDIVHQLDKDGNDVISAKLSDKPVWQRGRRGTGADGTVPNELDKPDFVGPGWANGAVKDIRDGKLKRAENTIPGGGTQVAQAPSQPPALVPGIESKIVEMYTKARPAMAARDMATVGRLIEQAETVAKSGNILPDKERGVVEKALQIIGMPKPLVDRYNLANLSAQEANQQQRSRPDQIQARKIALEAEIAKTGEATPEQLAKVKGLSDLATHVDKELDSNMIGWGEKIGLVPKLPPIDPTKPDLGALQARGDAARYLSQYYARRPQFFTSSEREQLTTVLNKGGDESLATLGTMHLAFKEQMPDVMREIAKDAPEAAVAGYLFGEKINPQAARDIMKAVAREHDPNSKGKVHKPNRAEAEPIAQAELGDTFKNFDQTTRDSIMHAADAIYTTRNQTQDKWQPDIYKQAIKDVIGQRKDTNGNVYGGTIPTRKGWISDSDRILLPPTWNASKAIDILEMATPQDLAAAGMLQPVSADGKPVSMTRLVRMGTFEQSGPVGSFRFKLKSADGREGIVSGVPAGSVIPNAPPADAGGLKAPHEYLQQGFKALGVPIGALKKPDLADGVSQAEPNIPAQPMRAAPPKAFILDMNKLEQVLRKRMPQAFWRE